MIIMLKYLGNGRIKDDQGKVWFFHYIRKKEPNFLSAETFSKKVYEPYENVLVAIGEKWVIDDKAENLERSKRIFVEKEFSFKEIEVQKEPFFMVKKIKF